MLCSKYIISRTTSWCFWSIHQVGDLFVCSFSVLSYDFLGPGAWCSGQSCLLGSRVRTPLWPSSFKETKCFFPLTRKDSTQSWKYRDIRKAEVGTMPYSYRMTSRVLYSLVYSNVDSTANFEQFGALYMHNLDDKYPTRPGFKSNTSFEPQPDLMSYRSRPYCGEPPWPRGGVLGFRPPVLEFRILCLKGSVISFISPSSKGFPGPVHVPMPICAQKWPKTPFISFHFSLLKYMHGPYNYLHWSFCMK